MVLPFAKWPYERAKRLETVLQAEATESKQQVMADDAVEWAETQESPISQLSEQIFHALTNLINDEALAMLKNTHGKNGLEARRKLVAHCNPRTAGRTRSRMQKILNPGQVQLPE